MNDKSDNPFLTVAEAADYLRLKKRTLDNMRWMGTGPKFRKHGGRIYYDFEEIKEWSLGLSGILCARPVSLLTFEPLTEDDGEL